jgi:toxin ParE1/3/4
VNKKDFFQSVSVWKNGGSPDYTAHEWSATQANTYLDDLETCAQLIAENPDLGMARETLFEGLLSFPCESHILFYKNTLATS